MRNISTYHVLCCDSDSLLLKPVGEVGGVGARETDTPGDRHLRSARTMSRGGQPGPFRINTAISRLRRMPLELIVKIGLPPDPAGRAGSGHSLRQNALDPGFMT